LFRRVFPRLDREAGAIRSARRATPSVTDYLVKSSSGHVVAEFTERESGKRNNRPEFACALAMCRAHRAALIVARLNLDRLVRNTHFLLSILEGSGGAGCVFCDLPTVPAGPLGKFFVSLLASVTELEAGLISQRTKAALAEAKKRGVKLGPKEPPGRTPGIEIAAARIAKARVPA
jgi:DNA invertase Pin-like site-specific DNA recombinase